MGVALGYFLHSWLLMLVLGPAMAWAVYALSGRLIEVAGRGAEFIYAPSGKSTPMPRGWSREEALVMKNRFTEAAALYEAATFDDPGDPEPFLRLARLHRDHLRQPALAVRWYRVARETTRITRPQALQAAEELVALCRREGRLGEASPELRWIATTFAGTAPGNQARDDLALLP